MSEKRKSGKSVWRKGEAFESIQDVAYAIARGERVYYNHKLYHHAFVRGFPLSTFLNGIPGRFFRAIEIVKTP